MDALQLLILPILLIQCDDFHVKIAGLENHNDLTLNVEKTEAWNIQCSKSKEHTKICKSYKECGFSQMTESKYTQCIINEKNGNLSITCNDTCKDEGCGWKSNKKFNNTKHAICRETSYERNSTDINTWKDVTNAVLHVNGSRERLKLHLRLNNETGKNYSQNYEQSCLQFCKKCINETGKNDSQNAQEFRQQICKELINDNTTNSTGWIIGAGGFLLGCLFMGTAVFFRKKQCGCKRDESGSPRENYQMTPSDDPDH